MIHNTSWPYANETGITEKLNCDVLVLGGGLAGCYAAIAAARRGQSVILVEIHILKMQYKDECQPQHLPLR